jgi:chromosome segregation ATPase
MKAEMNEASAIMALHKQVLVETGWECSTDSPPALKRAADTFRAEVERVVAERDATTQHLQDEYGAQIKALNERAERAEQTRGQAVNELLHMTNRAENAEREAAQWRKDAEEMASALSSRDRHIDEILDKAERAERDNEALRSLLKDILANDGGDGSECFDAIKLFDARKRGFDALAK